jgi:GT2 family glycosyltransferase
LTSLRPYRWLQRLNARLLLQASRLLPGSYPSADVVVCVHNALEHTRRCLDSLVSRTRPPFKLILVNDGSNAATTKFLKEFAARRGNVTYLQNDVAKGYARAANQGLRASKAAFVVLLNSDTIVTPNWLKHLLGAALARPDGGIFGPLSNAAGWQSIPESTDEDGSFVVNALPPDVSLDAYAQAIGAKQKPLYPHAWIVNGFCYMLSRKAIETVGILDEDSFPQGYGEEDDYSIRAMRAGFKAYIADNCYVYHAKSKSFTAARRRELIGPAQQALYGKHTKAVVSLAISETRQNEELVKARVHSTLLAEKAAAARPQPPLRIGWIVSAADTDRYAVEMTSRFSAWGSRAVLITPDGRKPPAHAKAARVVPLSHARSQRFDALVVGEPQIARQVLQIESGIHVCFHTAAAEAISAQMGSADFAQDPSLVHVADSIWTADRIKGRAPALELAGIVAGGLDTEVFRPRPVPQSHQLGCLGTEWLDDEAALAVLRSTVGLRRLELTRADLRQPELPSLIAQCRAFVSGAQYPEFRMLPLHAMACGVPVVIVGDDGAKDYAEHGTNALVVPVEDQEGLREAVRKLLTNNVFRRNLIRNGLRTAWRFNWDSAAWRFLDLLHEVRGAGKPRVGPHEIAAAGEVMHYGSGEP